MMTNGWEEECRWSQLAAREEVNRFTHQKIMLHCEIFKRNLRQRNIFLGCCGTGAAADVLPGN
jgi:hypothetical protein